MLQMVSLKCLEMAAQVVLHWYFQAQKIRIIELAFTNVNPQICFWKGTERLKSPVHYSTTWASCNIAWHSSHSSVFSLHPLLHGIILDWCCKIMAEVCLSIVLF
jgi:hypothetical protein